MADFLSRLAGRAMGVAPIVQPMIAPMYAARPAPIAGEQSGFVPLDADRGTAVEQEHPFASFSSTASGAHPVPMFAETPLITPEELQPDSANTGEKYIHGEQHNQVLRSDSIPTRHTLASSSIVSPREQGSSLPIIPAQESGDNETSKQENIERNNQSLDVAISSFSTQSGDIPSVQHDATRPMKAFTKASMPTTLSTQDNLLLLSSSSQQVFVQKTGGDTTVRNRLHENERYGEQRPVDDVLDGAGVVIEEAGSPQMRWAASPLGQSVSITEVPRSSGYGSRKRGDGTETAPQQTGQAEMIQATTPSIQVTIGRIEVRAMPAPPTRPSTQRSTPPVMNLEDYVNQRMKGER